MKKMCTQIKPFLNINRKNLLHFPYFPTYHNGFGAFRQGSERKNAAAVAAAFMPLSLTEGLAVGALVLGGICLVGTHQNTIQRAVVLAVAVVSTGLNGTLDALICVVIHNALPPSFGFGFSMAFNPGMNHGKISLFIAILAAACYDEDRELMFVVQPSGDVVGAIIDRPAHKCYVFALGFGEFAVLYCAGGESPPLHSLTKQLDKLKSDYLGRILLWPKLPLRFYPLTL